MSGYCTCGQPGCSDGSDLARTAAPAERFAAVLTRHQMVGEPSLLSSGAGWIWGCSCRATGAAAARSVAGEEYRAHVAAALAVVADDGLAERVRLVRIRQFAESKALSAKALGHDDRAWLDLLILCDGGSDA